MRYLLYHSITVMQIYILFLYCVIFCRIISEKEQEIIKSIPYRRYAIGYGIYYLILL